MPPRFCALALLVSCVAITARASDPFPYTSYVNANDVYLRSGPGQNYYPTEKLPRGCEVEIWRHDPGGWYAVRPTKDSFSWVAAEYLKPTEDGLAEVTGDRVVVRVGSALSDVRDVIQIHLNRGEEVEVIEAKRFGTGPAAQTWYKIAPPAGEFRWVHGKFVDREADVVEARPEPSRNRLLRDNDSTDEDNSESIDRDASRHVDQAEYGGRPSDRSRSRSGHVDDGITPIGEEDPNADHENRDIGRYRPRNEPGERLDNFVGTRTRARGSARSRAGRPQSALSRMVAEEPTVWSFDALQTRARRRWNAAARPSSEAGLACCSPRWSGSKMSSGG